MREAKEAFMEVFNGALNGFIKEVYLGKKMGRNMSRHQRLFMI